MSPRGQNSPRVNKLKGEQNQFRGLTMSGIRQRARDAAVKRTRKEMLNDVVSAGKKPTGTEWMKSKRKRRRVLDQENALINHRRKQNKNQGN